jgi:hypothetical protein
MMNGLGVYLDNDSNTVFVYHRHQRIQGHENRAHLKARCWGARIRARVAQLQRENKNGKLIRYRPETR